MMKLVNHKNVRFYNYKSAEAKKQLYMFKKRHTLNKAVAHKTGKTAVNVYIFR